MSTRRSREIAHLFTVKLTCPRAGHKLGVVKADMWAKPPRVYLPEQHWPYGADRPAPRAAAPLRIDLPGRTRLRWICAACVNAGHVRDEQLRWVRLRPLLEAMLTASVVDRVTVRATPEAIDAKVAELLDTPTRRPSAQNPVAQRIT